MKSKRNEPCPCGSGKKYKTCCAGKRTPSQWVALLSVVAFGLLAVWVVAGVWQRASEKGLTPQPTAGRVWSEEHGHWHDAPGTAGAPRPPGPTPPGKSWSEAHGHWHDAASPGQQPPGPAPPGKVWSAEHGHWHDAATGGEPEEPPVSYSDDVDEP
jgi:hypothetical protein